MYFDELTVFIVPLILKNINIKTNKIFVIALITAMYFVQYLYNGYYSGFISTWYYRCVL
jgi:hypothetical protein